MNHERKLLISAVIALFVMLGIGTILFKIIEGWSTLDSFYFTGITMLTIGYGDIYPKTPTGKIAVVIFGMIAIGIALYSVNLIARLAFRQNLESTEWLLKKTKSAPSKEPSSNQSPSEQDHQYK